MGKVRLGDIATFVNGRAYSMPELQTSGKYRIIRVGNFSGKDEWFYSDMELDSKKYCTKGDLLYKWACNFGPEIWNEEKAIYHYHIWKVIPEETKVLKEYLYYLLSFMTPLWMRATNGSTMVHITKETMEDHTVTIPDDLSKQRTIVKCLQAIDAKIANNKKLMTELEETARLIYDYWFTQFDFPDENGNPYRSSGGAMVYNETLHREIPAGWSVARLGEVCETRLGGTPDTAVEAYWGGDMPWLNSAEVATSPILEAEKTITEVGQKESVTSFAPSGSVLLSITRYIRPSVLAIDACFNQSVIAILENKDLSFAYLFPFIQSQVSRYLSLRTGAQQPHINKATVDTTPIAIPTSSVLTAYYKLAAPLYEQIVAAAKQSKELEDLRDRLLPMLMNGQVSVGVPGQDS